MENDSSVMNVMIQAADKKMSFYVGSRKSNGMSCGLKFRN